MANQIRVASRKSDLAMTQTRWVIRELERMNPGLRCDIVPISTKGDKILDVALSKVGGKGLFVSEIEEAILSGAADLAVHSLKDVPAQLADGLTLGAIPAREDARDALISRNGQTLAELPQGASVGTSSLRRSAQLKSVRPDLRIVSLRGNIDTRLKKLESENLDAIILAASGLRRMGWETRITQYIPVELCLPAIGQGILGIECRSRDLPTLRLLEGLLDPATELAARAERSLLQSLNGSCQVPIAGFAQVDEENAVHLRGLVASVDGSEVLRAQGTSLDPVDLGKQVADQLRSLGADRILETAAVSER